MHGAAALCTWVFSQAVSHCCRHSSEGLRSGLQPPPRSGTCTPRSSQGKHRVWEENLGWSPADGLILDTHFSRVRILYWNWQPAPCLACSPHHQSWHFPGSSWHSSGCPQRCPGCPIASAPGMRLALSPGPATLMQHRCFKAQPISGIALLVQCFPSPLFCPSEWHPCHSWTHTGVREAA